MGSPESRWLCHLWKLPQESLYNPRWSVNSSLASELAWCGWNNVKSSSSHITMSSPWLLRDFLYITPKRVNARTLSSGIQHKRIAPWCSMLDCYKWHKRLGNFQNTLQTEHPKSVHFMEGWYHMNTIHDFMPTCMWRQHTAQLLHRPQSIILLDLHATD